MFGDVRGDSPVFGDIGMDVRNGMSTVLANEFTSGRLLLISLDELWDMVGMMPVAGLGMNGWWTACDNTPANLCGDILEPVSD